jgi:hypothetical protein
MIDLKLCECFKNGNGIFWKKKIKNWADGMDVCVGSMGELAPVWLSMLGVVHLDVKDRVV